MFKHDVNLYYGFSLLQKFSLVLQLWMSAHIWKTDISVPPKRYKHGRQNITLHWINSIIRNNKIKCCFYAQNGCINKKILQQTILSNQIDSANYYVPRLYHNKRKHHNKQNVEPWKHSTSWGHTKVLFTCC